MSAFSQASAGSTLDKRLSQDWPQRRSEDCRGLGQRPVYVITSELRRTARSLCRFVAIDGSSQLILLLDLQTPEQRQHR